MLTHFTKNPDINLNVFEKDVLKWIDIISSNTGLNPENQESTELETRDLSQM